MKKFFYLALIYFFNRFPIRKNKIFLFSYYGSQYGCNPKYITEYMLQNGWTDRFDVVWAFNDVKAREDLKGFRKVRTMSFRYFYELCTSRVVITNFRTTDLFVKRKNQYYIQTWHSSLRLKQIEKDAVDSLPGHYLEMAKKDSRKCDLLLSGCESSTKIFKRSFWYDGDIFEHGSPRNDVLFQQDPELRRKVLDSLNVLCDRNVILYAPTFRKNNSLDVYDLDYQSILEKLTGRFGGEWVFLVKLHPHLLHYSDQLAVGDNVMDVTAYDDIQELLSVSDVLISDYSSLMFDFAITQRPCFLYVPDLAEYIDQDRKLYFDLKELPFIKAESNQELLSQMDEFDNEAYRVDLNRFLNGIGSFENGRACEQLLKHIDQVCFDDQNTRRTHQQEGAAQI